MDKIKFKPELIDKIIAGEKTMTRRMKPGRYKIEREYFCAEPYDNSIHYDFKPWKSPLYMPERAARCKISITDIRTEYLQDISEQDAIKEGFLSIPEFRDYINAIYHRDIWSENPWVVVLGFKKLENQNDNG